MGASSPANLRLYRLATEDAATGQLTLVAGRTRVSVAGDEAGYAGAYGDVPMQVLVVLFVAYGGEYLAAAMQVDGVGGGLLDRAEQFCRQSVVEVEQ